MAETIEMEISRSMNHMLQDTITIMQRHSVPQTKRLMEIWTETGILLDEWNQETREMLSKFDN
jgi:hypothetical protein